MCVYMCVMMMTIYLKHTNKPKSNHNLSIVRHMWNTQKLAIAELLLIVRLKYSRIVNNKNSSPITIYDFVNTEAHLGSLSRRVTYYCVVNDLNMLNISVCMKYRGNIYFLVILKRMHLVIDGD